MGLKEVNKMWRCGLDSAGSG